MIAAQNTGLFFWSMLDADLCEIAAVDWVADIDIVCEQLFHIASIIFVNALNKFIIVVGNIEVPDAFIGSFFVCGKSVVFGASEFFATVFVDPDIILPFVIVFAWQ